MEWPELQGEIRLRVASVGALLRAAGTAALPVPGLDWSVGELGAHLVTVPRRYRRMIHEPTPFPDRLSEVNDAEIKSVGVSDPAALADLLESETTDLLDRLGPDGARPVAFFGMPHTVMGVAGVLLGELLIHGLDLARAVNRPWEITRQQALAVSDGVLPSLPYIALDADVARRATGTYHLHLRGGPDWTITIRDGQAAFERRRPHRADLHVSADPVAYLLVGYQRMRRGRALSRGQIVAWGRKPWLAVPFGNLFRES